MSPTERANAERRIAEYDPAYEQARVDLLRLANVMLDDGERLDHVEAARAEWLACSRIVRALDEVAGAVVRALESSPDVMHKAFNAIHAAREEWRKKGQVAKALCLQGAACAECGVEAEHEDLQVCEGVGRGVICEACVEDAVNRVRF